MIYNDCAIQHDARWCAIPPSPPPLHDTAYWIDLDAATLRQYANAKTAFVAWGAGPPKPKPDMRRS